MHHTYQFRHGNRKGDTFYAKFTDYDINQYDGRIRIEVIDKLLFADKDEFYDAGDEMKVAIIGDTVSNLDRIYKNLNIVTVHVSSFFFYKNILIKENK